MATSNQEIPTRATISQDVPPSTCSRMDEGWWQVFTQIGHGDIAFEPGTGSSFSVEVVYDK